MQRRDILNIFFNRSTFEQPITMEPDPVLLTPAHLRTDNSTALVKEWKLSETNAQIAMEVCTQFAFTLILEYKTIKGFVANAERSALNTEASDLNTEPFVLTSKPSALIMGVKKLPSAAAHKENYIKHIGIHLGISDGCLFIGEVKDLRVIDKEKLAEGIQLTLTVNPLTDGKTYAKLKVTDQSGLMLSAIRSKQFTIDDWTGEIFTGTYFKTLYMEGRQLIKQELI